jgi:hypothetical protein
LQTCAALRQNFESRGAAAGLCERRQEEGFFFAKKKQKFFLNWAVLVAAPQAQSRKSFCAAFFKKRLLS